MWPPNVFCSHIGVTLGVCKLWLPGPYFFEPFWSRIGRSLGQNLGFHIFFKTSVLNSHENCFASSLEQLWEICRIWATGSWSPRGKAQWGQIFAGHISETIRPIFMIRRPYKNHLHPDAHWRVHYFLGLQGVLMTYGAQIFSLIQHTSANTGLNLTLMIHRGHTVTFNTGFLLPPPLLILLRSLQWQRKVLGQQTTCFFRLYAPEWSLSTYL